jgi:hypothetical protein
MSNGTLDDQRHGSAAEAPETDFATFGNRPENRALLIRQVRATPLAFLLRSFAVPANFF